MLFSNRSVLQVKYLTTPHVFWHLRREITKDDEYTLFNVTVFKKVKDEYLHKCREHKWVPLQVLPLLVGRLHSG